MASQYFTGSGNANNAFALYGAAQSPRNTHSDLRSLMRPNGSDPYSAQSSRASSASLASSSSNKCKNIRVFTFDDPKFDEYRTDLGIYMRRDLTLVFGSLRGNYRPVTNASIL
ncbi:hypothetical protein FRC07_012806 [Ceratobasidium sp. 392]|nr:hypothetical protein FRC07_012806 [Ceratobasidium sp. 392]